MSASTTPPRVSVLFSLACAIAFAGVGCGDFEAAMNAEREAPAEQPDVKPPQGEFLREADRPPLQPAVADAPPEAAPAGRNIPNPGAASAPSAVAPANALPIRLSVGVALAQTLPSGTGMSFSVDYDFQSGLPSQSSQYLWVIQRGDGQSLAQGAALERSGNLTLIVERLRPEAGPFSSHIVEVPPDGTQRKISNSIDMR